MTYDPSDDSIKSTDLGYAALREIRIRIGQYKPSPDRPDEQEWARQGVVDSAKLETLRRAG